MSRRRLIWQQLSDLATQMGQQTDLGDTDVSELMRLLGKLGRVQFKANSLFEAQLKRQQETLGSLQTALSRQEEIVAHLHGSQREQADGGRHDLLKAMLPILDGLEAALSEGRRKMASMENGDGARGVLTSWLDGIGVVYRQLTDALSQAGVEPIDAVGSRFDPQRHVAAGVEPGGSEAPGIVVAEEVRGYIASGRVLRYAEVIVSRPSNEPSGGRQSGSV